MKKNFEFDFGEVSEWVLASSLKQAKEYHLAQTECGDHDDVQISIVPVESWAKKRIINPDNDFFIETFEDFANRHEPPIFISTTNY